MGGLYDVEQTPADLQTCSARDLCVLASSLARQLYTYVDKKHYIKFPYRVIFYFLFIYLFCCFV